MSAFDRARRTYRAVNGAQPPDGVRDALSAAVSSALGTSPAAGHAAAGARLESNA
jgi:hypothetical protein